MALRDRSLRGSNRSPLRRLIKGKMPATYIPGRRVLNREGICFQSLLGFVRLQGGAFKRLARRAENWRDRLSCGAMITTEAQTLAQEFSLSAQQRITSVALDPVGNSPDNKNRGYRVSRNR
jgi:hypothetical protein